jgi:hypothetical protein
MVYYAYTGTKVAGQIQEHHITAGSSFLSRLGVRWEAGVTHTKRL